MYNSGDRSPARSVIITLAELANVKPAAREAAADAEDNNYRDDESADWKSTTRGQKSAGDTSVTRWRGSGEDIGTEKAYSTVHDRAKRGFGSGKYPSSTVDIVPEEAG